MPILKKDEPLKERPVIILLYGDPGVGKTSLFNTSANPLLINFDRGHDRAILRQDTLVMDKWEDVETEEKAGTFKDYATIGIDTAKAALDDFLMAYVIKQDYKNAKNKLAAYGAIGDAFKVFVSNRRAEAADIIILAHAKDEKDGDLIKKFPDVTGGSYQLLLRIADMIGYMTMRNNQRIIQWDPTDTTIGKNVARLPVTVVPDKDDPALRTFMDGIVQKVKKSIVAMSEAQAVSLRKIQAFETEINGVETAAELTTVVANVAADKDLAKTVTTALKVKISEKAKAMGWTWDKEAGAYKDPNQAEAAQKETALAQDDLGF